MPGKESKCLRKSGSEAEVREKCRCQGRVGRLERALENWEDKETS